MRVAEIAGTPGRRDRGVHRGNGMRIFRADVDVALGGADGDACDRHAFDHDEGIAFHDHAVGKGAAVASSALQTMYLRSALACATVFHLMPVGKPAPPRRAIRTGDVGEISSEVSAARAHCSVCARN